MSPLKKKNAILLAAVIVAILIGLYIANLGGVPLVSLNQSNFDRFAQSFDSASGEIRLVLLVSPT